MKSEYEANIWKFYVYKYLCGLWIPATIWTLYLLARGFNFTQIGMVDIVFAAIMIVFTIPSGAFADLIGRKYSVFIGFFLFAIASVLFGLTGKYHLILLILILDGIGITLFSGPDNALLFDSLKRIKKDRQYARIRGKAEAFFSFGSASGGFAGAYLFTLNISYPLFAGAVVFFATGLWFLLMKEPFKSKKKYNLKSHWMQVVEGVKYARKHPNVRWIIAFSAVIVALFWYQAFIVQPTLIRFGFDVKHFGILFAFIWGIEGIVSWNAYRIISFLGEKRALFAVALVHVFCFVILSRMNMWYGVVFIIFNYMGRGLFNPASDHYMQRHIVSSHRATTTAVRTFAIFLLMMISMFVFSRLTDALGIRPVYLIVGITITAATVGLWLGFPENKK